MTSLMWSTLERMFPRGAAALLLLTFASVATPTAMGYYSWLVIITTLVNVLGPGAIGHIIVRELGSHRGRGFLRRFVWWYGFGGGLVSASVLVLLLAVAPVEDHGYIWPLAPAVLVSAASASGLVAVAELQRAQRWRLLARNQLLSAVVSLIIALVSMLVLPPSAALALHLLLTEAFTAMLARLARRRTPAPLGPLPFGVPPAGQFGWAAGGSAISWLQQQSDRLLVGAFAPIATLGQYNLAWSLSRSIGDSVAYGSLAVLRAALLSERAPTDHEIRNHVRQYLLRTATLIPAAIAITFLLAGLALPALLGATWTEALHTSMVLSLFTVPFCIEQAFVTVLSATRRMGLALPLRVLDLALALPVIAILPYGLVALGWYALARHAVLAILAIAAAGRRFVPVGAICLHIGITVVSSAGAWWLTSAS